MTQPKALFLYAITAADAARPPAGFDGVGGAPLRLVRAGPFGAVVSAHAPGDLDDVMNAASPEEMESALFAYHHCLNKLSQTLDLLPVRFGTLLKGAAGLEDYFSQNADQLTSALAQTRGHLEWTIRLRQVDQPVAADAAAAPKDYLRQRQRDRQKAEQAAQTRRDLVQEIADQIAICPAREVVSEAVKKEQADMKCFAALRALSPRGRDTALLERLSAIVDGVPDVAVDVFGPEAPFRFAALEER